MRKENRSLSTKIMGKTKIKGGKSVIIDISHSVRSWERQKKRRRMRWKDYDTKLQDEERR